MSADVRGASIPFALLALATLAFSLIGLWVWPLGAGAFEPALPIVAGIGVLVLALGVGWKMPATPAVVAAGVGAFGGLTLGWAITVAVDHREAGDGLLFAWGLWTAAVVTAGTVGATVRRLAGTSRATA